jgi:hypothetical protein
MFSRFLGRAHVYPITLAILVGLFSTSGCSLSGSERQEERSFQDLERVTFRVNQIDDESAPLRLEGFTPEGTDSLVVEDSLRMGAGTRFTVSLQSESSDVQPYLTTAGPPAVLFYKSTPSLDAFLNLKSISVSVQQLSRSSRGNTRSGHKGKQDDHSAESHAASQASAPAVSFRFEIATADTSATGSLRLRLGRYRDTAAGDPDHIDFDVVLPIRVTRE